MFRKSFTLRGTFTHCSTGSLQHCQFMKQMNELRWTGVGVCEELFAESPVWLEAELVWNFIPGLPVLCVSFQSPMAVNLGPVQFQ